MAQLSFSKPERDFLKNNEVCRIATCHDSVPHVVPVAYIFENDTFFIATDYETRKYQNIKHNNKVALVVDVYSSVNNKALCVQGRAEIIEEGQEFGRLYKLFYSRFEWVRQDPWKEGEAAFIKVVPISKTSWGLK